MHNIKVDASQSQLKTIVTDMMESQVVRQLVQDKIDLQQEVKELTQKLETSQSKVKSLREQLAKIQVKSPTNAFTMMMNAAQQNTQIQPNLANKQHLGKLKATGRRKAADQVCLSTLTDCT